MATMKNRVRVLEQQSGATSYKLVMREDGETNDEARERAGLADWQGQVIFLSFADTKL